MTVIPPFTANATDLPMIFDADAMDVAARERVTDIAKLFAEIRECIVVWRAEARAATKTEMQTIFSKLGELQSMHVRLLHAEEAFNEKFNRSADADTVDYDTIRHDLGCALDRIRAALDAEKLSGQPDRG